MNANNLKIGDIIITDVNEVDGDQYPKIIVVGTAPSIVAGQTVSFHPVLKRNRREDYYVAANTTTLDLDGENLDNVVAVLSTMEDAFLFNVSDVFDVEADDEWVEKVNKKIAIAFKKRNWVLTPAAIDDEAHDVEVPVVEEDPSVISRFYVVLRHDPDFHAEDVLNDWFGDDVDIIEHNVVNL